MDPEPAGLTAVKERPGLLSCDRAPARRHGRPRCRQRSAQGGLCGRGVAAAVSKGLVDEAPKDKGQLGRVRREEEVRQLRRGEFRARLPQPRAARSVVEAVGVCGRPGGFGGAEGFVGATGIAGLGYNVGYGCYYGFSGGQVGAFKQ